MLTLTLPKPIHARVIKGGAGSGHHGHGGRPGKRGGSAAARAGGAFDEIKLVGAGASDPRIQALKQLPEEHLMTIQTVAIMPVEEIPFYNPATHPKGRMVLDTWKEKTGVTIYLAEDEATVQTAVHEAGHAVYATVQGQHFASVQAETGLRIASWKDPVDQYYRESKRRPVGESLSEIARTNGEEYFSESYMSYVLAPSVLKGTEPKMYDFLKTDIFKGKEYSPAKEYPIVREFEKRPGEKGGAGSGHFGHGGRPGKRGGSASLAAGMPGGAVEYTKEMEHFVRGRTSKLPGFPELGSLAEAAEVPARYIRGVDRAWSGNSTTGLAALSIQEATAEEFGLEMPEWQKTQLAKHREAVKNWPEGKEKPDYLLSTTDEAARTTGLKITTAEGRKALLGDHPNEKSANRAIVREMYSQNQEAMKALGIEEVTVYRGIRVASLDPGMSVGNHLAISGNGAISSWSAKERNANRFAGQKNKTAQIEAKGGFAVKMTIPRERVFSTASTGFGWPYEHELVVLQGASDVAAVSKTYSK